MINVKVGNGKPRKPKKKKPKKVKPSAINRALVKSSKESAKRGARSSALIKKALKRRTRTVLGIGASRRREPRGLQGAITNRGKSAIRGGSAALAAFIAVRYSAKAIAKYQDYAGRLRRSIRLRRQVVQIDAATFRVRQYIVRTDTAGNNPYSCTCPDFSQFSSDDRNWLGSKAGPFNPCKHMMAVRDRRTGKWVCSGGVCTLDPNAVDGYATQALCEAAVIPPLFLGGQCSTQYAFVVEWDIASRSTGLVIGSANANYSCAFGGPGGFVYGPIESPFVFYDSGSDLYEVRFSCRNSLGDPVTYTAGSSGFSTILQNIRCANVSGKPDRCDGLPDDCGDLAGSCPI